MAGTLSVQKIQGLASSATPTKIEIASGHTLTQPGSIVQTVSGITTTYTNVASTTFADTTLTATITPKFSTSKILIIISQNVGSDRDNNSAACSLQLLRDSTVIQTQTYISFIEAGGASATKVVGPWAVTHLDSPSTTSATTYKIQLLGQNNTMYVNRTQYDSDATGVNRIVSQITVKEVAA